MSNTQSRFVGEIGKRTYDRTKVATSRLLDSLIAAHSNDIPHEVHFEQEEVAPEPIQPPIPNELIAECSRIILPIPSYSITKNIQMAVLTEYPGISLSDIKSRRRMADIVRPRQVAMYLCKTLTSRSLPDIGRRMGGRDHTTVLHAVRKIEKLIQVDPVLAEKIERIKAAFEEMRA